MSRPLHHSVRFLRGSALWSANILKRSAHHSGKGERRICAPGKRRRREKSFEPQMGTEGADFRNRKPTAPSPSSLDGPVSLRLNTPKGSPLRHRTAKSGNRSDSGSCLTPEIRAPCAHLRFKTSFPLPSLPGAYRRNFFSLRENPRLERAFRTAVFTREIAFARNGSGRRVRDTLPKTRA